jgi:hypothetical protein
MPTDQEMQRETIGRKRDEYRDMVLHYFGNIQYSQVNDIKQQGEMS